VLRPRGESKPVRFRNSVRGCGEGWRVSRYLSLSPNSGGRAWFPCSPRPEFRLLVESAPCRLGARPDGVWTVVRAAVGCFGEGRRAARGQGAAEAEVAAPVTLSGLRPLAVVGSSLNDCIDESHARNVLAGMPIRMRRTCVVVFAEWVTAASAYRRRLQLRAAARKRCTAMASK
jgi:hypothetical protein